MSKEFPSKLVDKLRQGTSPTELRVTKVQVGSHQQSRFIKLINGNSFGELISIFDEPSIFRVFENLTE
jgi:hypothetical protein